jgi:hypothetical protein
LVEFDILDNFEGKSEVAKQYVYAQEANEAEVAQHVIERQRAVITHEFSWRGYQYSSSTRRHFRAM